MAGRTQDRADVYDHIIGWLAGAVFLTWMFGLAYGDHTPPKPQPPPGHQPVCEEPDETFAQVPKGAMCRGVVGQA